MQILNNTVRAIARTLLIRLNRLLGDPYKVEFELVTDFVAVVFEVIDYDRSAYERDRLLQDHCDRLGT